MLMAVASACASTSSPQPVSRAMQDGVELASLLDERAQQPLSDFLIGPGDTLEVTVPQLPELQEWGAQVAADGTLTLPLIGSVEAVGLTEGELTRRIEKVLDTFMHSPSASVAILKSKSRLVGVIGAVNDPGVYPMSSPSDTLLDLLTAAGGLAPEAGSRIHFVPVSEEAAGDPKEVSLAAVQMTGRKRLVIEVSGDDLQARGDFLSIPMRPGDVIIAPERGQVQVTGWVNDAKSYEISPGMTVLGAVAAAGGANFGANRKKVSIARNGPDGFKQQFRVNLKAVESGDSSDVRVEPGDVVYVHANPVTATFWGVGRFFSGIFAIGL